ncbi:MAG: DUF721 domain-containing protein [Paludibacteraceae bacterium]|nr:DUF721 domain-containing protein [Paludibacteraceae bacterium]MBR6041377.1 DUF721 domain-containing protein [Paludibacteraceae bacterium]MCR5569147.1 DUF721 domain-containing protein [Paludibacteraceae bacterium]
MKRTNMEMAGNVLKQFLESTTIGSNMSQQEAVLLWPKVAGEAIAKYTQNVSIYNGTLFVQLKSSIAADAIRTRQQELVEKMNQELGASIVKEIRTR